MSSKRKKKKIKSSSVLVAVDKSEVNYSGKWFPSPEPMTKTDGSSIGEIKVFGSLTELFKFMDNNK